MEQRGGFIVRVATVFAVLAGLFIFHGEVVAADDDGFSIGGALRYNFVMENYDGAADSPLNTYFTFDTWRINVDGSAAGVDLSFEYRFYPTFGSHFIHHGFLGYSLTDDLYMELGATQVPFGITTYASHSWWFQSPYYVGLEDDYDMGINFDYTPVENAKISVAYFRQAEPEGPIFGGDVTFGNSGAGRYSYDVTPTQDKSIRELNTVNLRAAYTVIEGVELGVSAQFGGIYNSASDRTEMATAFAGHLLADYMGFNLKAEVVQYDYNAPSNDPTVDEPLDIIPMGAYGFTYDVAAEAMQYVAGLAYSIPVNIGPISSIQPYVDYTFTDKTNENFYDMQQLVPGMLITAGSIYTYVDYAMGVNHPWLTSTFGQGLGVGMEDAPWNARFNVNIGYYF